MPLPRRPKEKLRPGAISPDAYDDSFEQERANEIADKVWRMSHGYGVDRKTIIEWSGR